MLRRDGRSVKLVGRLKLDRSEEDGNELISRGPSRGEWPGVVKGVWTGDPDLERAGEAGTVCAGVEGSDTRDEAGKPKLNVAPELDWPLL